MSLFDIKNWKEGIKLAREGYAKAPRLFFSGCGVVLLGAGVWLGSKAQQVWSKISEIEPKTEIARARQPFTGAGFVAQDSSPAGGVLEQPLERELRVLKERHSDLESEYRKVSRELESVRQDLYLAKIQILDARLEKVRAGVVPALTDSPSKVEAKEAIAAISSQVATLEEEAK